MTMYRACLAIAVGIILTGCVEASDSPIASVLREDPAPLYSSGEIAPGEPGHYIVTFDERISNPRALARLLVPGAEPSFIYSNTMKGFAAELSRGAVEGIRRHPHVVSVVEDTEMALEPVVGREHLDSGWALQRIAGRERENSWFPYLHEGRGVNVYVVDTGVNEHHRDLPEARGPGWTFSSAHPAWVDCYGHGTQVASLAVGHTAGVAKGATLHSYRVTDCAGRTRTSRVIAALDHIAQYHQKPAVVNISLAFRVGHLPREYQYLYWPLEHALRNVVSRGVTVVAGAGNAGRDACEYTPARVPDVIAVAASDWDDKRSVWSSTSSSNWGNCVDLFAPGSFVKVALHTSTTDFGPGDGTSYAAPYVAGAAAAFLSSEPFAPPTRVRAVLNQSATRGLIGDTRGTPNRLLFSLFTTATIAGPNEILSPGHVTWSAVTTGGNGLQSYRWDRSPDGFNWALVSTTDRYSAYVEENATFLLRLSVNFNGLTTESQTVQIIQRPRVKPGCDDPEVFLC
jgi:subtilisin family serine protease